MKKCGYCKKEKVVVSEMLSNGYCICKECAQKEFGKEISELETMEQATNKKRRVNRVMRNYNAAINDGEIKADSTIGDFKNLLKSELEIETCSFTKTHTKRLIETIDELF